MVKPVEPEPPRVSEVPLPENVQPPRFWFGAIVNDEYDWLTFTVGSLTAEPGAEPSGLNCTRSPDAGVPVGDQLLEVPVLVPLLFHVYVAAVAVSALPATTENTHIARNAERATMTSEASADL